MVEETQSQNSQQGGEEGKSLHFLDFVPPNPFIRPWMEGFMPRNILGRDLLVLTLGTIIVISIMLSATVLSEGLGQYVVVVIGGVIVLVLQGDGASRYTIAAVRLRQEKKSRAPSREKSVEMPKTLLRPRSQNYRAHVFRRLFRSRW